jgi:hypothetical protein
MYVGLIGCDQGGGFEDSEKRGGSSIMQDEAVDLQHGTGVDGNSHPFIKFHRPH